MQQAGLRVTIVIGFREGRLFPEIPASLGEIGASDDLGATVGRIVTIVIGSAEAVRAIQLVRSAGGPRRLTSV
ncbi:MAG: hypothetical protein IT318_18485 [Anaerolineales bacterium]|nr:hypothetical protein [Anaerolineales bacterium]